MKKFNILCVVLFFSISLFSCTKKAETFGNIYVDKSGKIISKQWQYVPNKSYRTISIRQHKDTLGVLLNNKGKNEDKKSVIVYLNTKTGKELSRVYCNKFYYSFWDINSLYSYHNDTLLIYNILTGSQRTRFLSKYLYKNLTSYSDTLCGIGFSFNKGESGKDYFLLKFIGDSLISTELIQYFDIEMKNLSLFNESSLFNKSLRITKNALYFVNLYQKNDTTHTYLFAKNFSDNKIYYTDLRNKNIYENFYLYENATSNNGVFLCTIFDDSIFFLDDSCWMKKEFQLMKN